MFASQKPDGFSRRALRLRRSPGYRWLVRLAALVLVLSGAPQVGLLNPSSSQPAQAASSCPAGGCSVKVVGQDFATGAPLSAYNFIVNDDNSKLPSNPQALSTESNAPMRALGDQTHNTVKLEAGRYLISVRGHDHKMWGAYINLPGDADASGNLTVTVQLTEQSEAHPLPLGKIRVFVFNDNTWTNGAPDTEEAGLPGFTVDLTDQINSDLDQDYTGKPLCGGRCTTGADGFVEIPNLGPATYNIEVNAPVNQPCNRAIPGSTWQQTTTIDGGLTLLAPVEEGADGTGAPGEQLWEPPTNRTAYWFGFVCVPQPIRTTGTGEVVGTAKNWVEWAPYTTGTFGDPVDTPIVALSSATTDTTIYVGQGDVDGNFDIQRVPAGDYNLSIWDEQLSYIMRMKPVHVNAGQMVDVNETGDDGSIGVGVSRWFGWLDGTVYLDQNGNGRYDPGVDKPIPNTDVDNRWRDGSIKDTTTSDANGHYEYTNAEGGQLGRWFINEQGFSRYSAYPGPSLHDERDPGNINKVVPSCGSSNPPANPCIPTDQGGGLLTNTLLLEGHRETVDWGKSNYDPNKPGQIVGITYYNTTRNEFDPRFMAHEDYEPAVPNVTVYLETEGPDGLPNTADDVVVNKYVTDKWQQPNANQDPQPGNSFTQSCNPLRDWAGTDVTAQFNQGIGPNCLEVPLTGEQTKDGAFDGGYAFSSYCPDGIADVNAAPDAVTCNDGSSPDAHALVAGKYITHAVMPKGGADDTRDCNAGLPTNDKNVTAAVGSVPGGGTGCLYRPSREEDVNVDLGNQFTPAVPPYPCVGDDHLIDQTTLTPRNTLQYGKPGAHGPLCDKREVSIGNQQNANADFFLETNQPTDPNGENAADTHVGDVAQPGRLVGQVFNDIYFERDLNSPWYGEPRPIANIPIGIYARVDTKPNASCPDATQPGVRCFDSNIWRLLKTVNTGPDGTYEAVVPSTETFNCPIPQGPCPGMYVVVVDDPGSKIHPNSNYNPNVLTANTPTEAWPGLTTQLDTPVDPISGTACEDPAGGTTPDPSDPARPDVLQVSSPVVSGSSRQVTIQSDFIGGTKGTVRLTDARTGQVTTLSGTAIPTWTQGSGSTPDTIVINVPAVSSSFPPGPKELAIVTSAGVASTNGITLHVVGPATGSNPAYQPNVVNVAAPTLTGHELQNAIDAASVGSVLVLKPGTYNENVLVWKPLRIQGLGPGGVIGAHELQGRDPEDPRFNIPGTTIDGRYFQQNLDAYNNTISAHGPYILPPFATSGANSTVLTGADVTFVAKSNTAYDAAAVSSGDAAAFNGARIDGVGLLTGHGDGAGGIQTQAQINNLQITNDVLENNGGVVAGGIGIGQPYVHAQHNYNVRIANDKVIGNGGLTSSGGIGIFYGSNNYEVANSQICANFSVDYGAGVSHIGLSPGGKIHDNRIYYNEAVGSGGGVAVESEVPVGRTGLGDGSGAVDLDRNLIQSNTSTLDDGGGLFVLDALKERINVRDNMIVNNLAADMGGAITLDDASNVAIVNNTVANNETTGSSENSKVGVPHAAGLASEANDPAFQSQLPAGSPRFSNPVALFNNIFWNNDAMTLDQFGPGATLVDQGFIDFEVRGTGNNTDHFTPATSLLTNGLILEPNGTRAALPGGQGNVIGVDPGFVQPFTNELTVSGSRLDPQQAAVTITGADPPVGLTGDYHILRPAGAAALAASGVVDRGRRCSTGTGLAACTGSRGLEAPRVDFDNQTRPQRLVTARNATPWDIGADELTGSAVTLP